MGRRYPAEFRQRAVELAREGAATTSRPACCWSGYVRSGRISPPGRKDGGRRGFGQAEA